MPIAQERASHFERLLAAAVRKAGWRVRPPRRPAAAGPGLVAGIGNRRYLFMVQASSEGRCDRLIPLLSQAILQAKSAARRAQESVVPVAVVAAGRLPPAVAGRILEFGRQHAPEVALGVIDDAGLRAFAGHGLEALNANPERRPRNSAVAPGRVPNLFSDLNQWMLKVLLGQSLSPSLIAVPRGAFQNAGQLARASGVSIMSAFRFLDRLRAEGFLDKAAFALRVVRVDELLGRWASANRQSAQEIPAKWLIKREARLLYSDISTHVSAQAAASPGESKLRRGHVEAARPRCCVGLFAAADLLGFGFVRGVPPHLYLERFDEELLRQWGLRLAGAAEPVDIVIRVPANREALFRAAVVRDGVPVSDAIQAWLDVSVHPARGPEQAALIRRRALAPLLGMK